MYVAVTVLLSPTTNNYHTFQDQIRCLWLSAEIHVRAGKSITIVGLK